MPIDQDTPAPNGAEAIQAAGQAVNDQVLESAHQILSAVPIAAEAAERVKSRSESTGWQIGRYTGLRIAKFQNWLYEANRAWRFTDGTLCVLWCVELPDARSPYASKPHLVRSTRTEYNAGRHQAPKPHTPSRSYRRGDAARSGQPDRQQTQGPRSEPDASSQAERVETNAAGVMTGPASPTRPESPLPTAIKWAISEFPKGRKYLISLSFRGKAIAFGLRTAASESWVDCRRTGDHPCGLRRRGPQSRCAFSTTTIHGKAPKYKMTHKMGVCGDCHFRPGRRQSGRRQSGRWFQQQSHHNV